MYARTTRLPLPSLAVASTLVSASPAFAQSSETPPPLPAAEDPARDTDRAIVGVAGLMFASYPGSLEDPGPALLVGKPLWLGVRHRFFQWTFDGQALGGFGTHSKHAHASVSPQFGFHLFLGPWFGFDIRLGPAALLQVGRHTVAGLGFGASGGYVFRFWEDDRRRLKLEVIMQGGGYFARDPGNDLGASAGAFGGALVYETPF